MINKKAVSEIVSYALLIVIAVGLSVVVYSFLKVYTPKPTLECPDGIAIAIKDITCAIGSPGLLNITLINKGNFNITNVFIRIGNESKTTRYSITVGKKGLLLPTPLPPGDSGVRAIENLIIPSKYLPHAGDYVLEIQPAVMTDKGLATCNKATITEKVTCS